MPLAALFLQQNQELFGKLKLLQAHQCQLLEVVAQSNATHLA